MLSSLIEYIQINILTLTDLPLLKQIGIYSRKKNKHTFSDIEGLSTICAKLPGHDGLLTILLSKVYKARSLIR